MSKDGQLIADIAKKFGIKAIRGSSSKKGTSAFLQLIHKLKQDTNSVAITPDGPRGPRFKVQDGVITLSRASHIPITPITCETNKKWEINSWDRFQIPKPFSSCIITFHPPISVPEKCNDEEFEQIKLKLQNALGG